jgi:hypothetical protein
MSMRLAFLIACMSVIACRDPPFMPADLGGRDMSANADGAADMTMKMYKAATINQIDTNPITGGMFGRGTAVSLTGVIVTTPVRYFPADSQQRCDYECIVQDPACNTPPCGLELVAHGPAKGSANCPDPDMSGTSIGDLRVGDKVDVQGTVDTFTMNPPADGGTSVAAITQHEVEVDSLTKMGTGNITATVVTDGSKFRTYAANAEWQKYEGTLLKLQPGGLLTVTKNDGANVPYHFYTDPGNTDWGTHFFGIYRADGGTDFPQAGQQFTSISGVVKMTFGGAIHPRFMSDFVR